MNDIIRAKGSAAFGTRLRRLSERLDRQIEALYGAQGIAFQPRWYPLITALIEQREASVGELAAMLGITHAAVSQVRGELIDAGLIRVKADPADKRRQLLALSHKGARYAEKLAPLWLAIAVATEELLAQTAPNLLAELSRVEAALEGHSMAERVAVKTTRKIRGKHALAA